MGNVEVHKSIEPHGAEAVVHSISTPRHTLAFPLQYNSEPGISYTWPPPGAGMISARWSLERCIQGNIS